MSQLIKVFIASPSDVLDERNIAKCAIEALNTKLVRLYDISLQPVRWEDFAALTPRDEAGGVQAQLNPWVRASPIFVGILYRRYGTPSSPTSEASGTEEEFNVALKHRQSITILSYFRELSDADLDSSQTKQVLDMRERLREQKVVDRRYTRPSDFAGMIALDLLEAVVLGMPEWQRRDELRQFFRLGISTKQDNSHVMICYPPIHKHDPHGSQGTYNWHRRLLPNVVFEDMKAVQKLEACMRKIGVREVKALTTHSNEVHDPAYNKIWLCLPRNVKARERMESYGNRSRFQLIDEMDDHHHIHWKSQHGEVITVQSPLAKYLRGRGADASESRWKNDYGTIVARDFAVISRFAYTGGAMGRAQEQHPFWEYFFFGIRGLGTWGAAWFVENKASELARAARSQGNEDVQILLQVTFHRHRIVEVIDVSDKSQEYFDGENSGGTIADVVRHNPPT